ncbi:ADP-ribosyltransferase [Bacillus cereus]|uniref:ADP-ribosyltransferase n=2 Tax=Bacillus cereus TaxID=1396 RepID=UPI0009C5FA40|nr:ADP-ribosyltransferase [Bacillus cereus]OPA04741.1 hypothetical protein BHL31_28000 [Bacillus cereus]
MPYVNDIHDFEKNKDEAKKWAEERYSDWQERLLTRLEKEEIMDFMNNKEDAQQLNNYLEDTRGNIPETSEYRENIERLDKGLKRVKTEQAIFVYQRVSEQYFGHEVGSFREDSIKIDQIKFDEFKEKFIQNQSVLKENGYMEASLSGISPNLAKEPCIYIRLKVPKGTHGGYTGNLQGTEGGTHDFLLDRGYGIQFTDAKIITEKGKQYIKVEAELLTKENLDQKIKEYSRELNLQLGLNISENLEFIYLDLTGRYIHQNLEISTDVVKNMKNVNQLFWEKLNEEFKHYESPYAPFNIVDYQPTNHPAFEYLKNTENDYALGLHLTEYGHETIISLKNINDKHQLASFTALHELGHALDDLVFKNISLTPDFDKIHKREQPSFIPGSYFEKVQEYFAECFAYYYYIGPENSNQILQDEAPQTYEFISKLENFIPQIKLKNDSYLVNDFNINFIFHNSICNIYYRK